MKKTNNIPSLYIHIPFCETICHYCDFPKLQYFRNFAIPYLEKLRLEIVSYEIGQLETIYVGGGTPTSLDDDLFLELLEIIKPYTNGVKEYTFEANPESLSIEKLQMMKAYGVNRISIGVESTNDKILSSINRHHTFNDVKTAVLRAKSLGFDNLNLDLIIGLPQVSLGLLKRDLSNLLELKVPHLSTYSLTVHPNTVFGINKCLEPKDDYARELYDVVDKELTEHGYTHYEVSNFALPGYESKHNFTYWRNEQYYGIGMGASGYVNGVRYTNTKSINDYLNGITVVEKEVISKEDELEYQIMLNLRTNQGIDLIDFKNKFDIDLLQSKKIEIEEMISGGYLYLKDQHLIATYQGMMTLDQIILKLI